MAKLTREQVEQIIKEAREKGERADLSWANLFKSNLIEVNLSKANLRRADLSGTDLRRADLSETNLFRANLRGVDLREADLRGADLRGADLYKATIDDTTQIDDRWQLVWEIVNQGEAGRDLSEADLSEADLSKASLSEANLSKANLSKTDLYRTNLNEANLSEANLFEANLSGTNLRGADLRGADLRGANLYKAKIDNTTQIDDRWRLVWEIVNQGAAGRDLSEADLSGANLSGANLSGANLSGANLSGVYLIGADLSKADLSGANLSLANLFKVNLIEANLIRVNLSRAYLSLANLIGANLSLVNLIGANLMGASLSLANLMGASLSLANLIGATIDDTTRIDAKWRLVWEIVNQGAARRDFSEVDLSEAYLVGANLSEVDLSEANLSKANLSRTDLSGADLRQANLLEADLSGADLHGAKIDDTTQINREWLPIEEKPSPDAEIPGPVRFTTYHPEKVKPEVWYKFLVYAHLPSALEAVKRDKLDRLKEEATEYGKRSGEATHSIAREAEIMVVPELPGCRFNPPQASFLWLKDWHCVEFELQATPDEPDFELGAAVNGRVEFRVEGFLVAEAKIWAYISDEADEILADRPDTQVTTEPFGVIFVSYSHKDTLIVDRLEKFRKAFVRMQYLHDVHILRSSEEWNPALRGKIQEADIFQLCWSQAAKQSSNVEQEWRYALGLSRPSFIRPVYWEKPLPEPPPELNDIHFAYLDLVPHLPDKRSGLQKQYNLLSEKIERLRMRSAIEDDPATKFKLEKQIEEAEAERDKIAQQIEDLDIEQTAKEVGKAYQQISAASQ